MERQLNDRQLEVLRWIADGCPEGKWPDGDFSYKTSTAALKSRSLVTIQGHGRTWTAAITDAGTHYLEHGTYPPGAPAPAVPASAKRRRRATPVKLDVGDAATETLHEATALIAKLQESRTLTVTDPEDSVRAHYRRLLHACRVHHLVPENHDLRFTGRSSGDIVIMLTTGSAADTTDWDRIRTTARKVTTNLEALRSALETTSILGSVSDAHRPRAIEVVLDLADNLRAHELRLGVNIKLKTPKLFLQVGTRRRTLTLTETLDEVPHVPTSAEQRALRRAPWTQIPKTDPVPSGRLRLQVERDGSHQVAIGHNSYSYERNRDTWSDEHRKPLERQVRDIARSIKQGVVDDDDAREREEQRRAEAQEAYAREQAAQRQAWEEIRTRASAKATLEIRETTFTRAFEDWQEAQALRSFAKQLEAEATSRGVLDSRPRLREWLEWARARADEINPIVNLERLDDSAFDAPLSPEDLRPHMDGWDPSQPHKDYSSSHRGTGPTSPHVPQRRAWHPGMRDKPSWWRD